MNPFFKIIIIGIGIGFGTLWLFKSSKTTTKLLYILGISVLTLILLSAIGGDFSFITSPFDWFAWRLIFILIITASAFFTRCLVNAVLKILRMKTKDEAEP